MWRTFPRQYLHSSEVLCSKEFPGSHLLARYHGVGVTKPVLYASSVHTARAKNTCQVDEGRMQYRARVHLSWEGVLNCEGQSRD